MAQSQRIGIYTLAQVLQIAKRAWRGEPVTHAELRVLALNALAKGDLDDERQ